MSVESDLNKYLEDEHQADISVVAGQCIECERLVDVRDRNMHGQCASCEASQQQDLYRAKTLLEFSRDEFLELLGECSAEQLNELSRIMADYTAKKWVSSTTILDLGESMAVLIDDMLEDLKE